AAVAAGPRTRDEAAAWIAAAARRLRQDRPTDPAPYLMLRGFRWGELRGAGADDPRLLAAPSTEVRTRLKGLLLDASWVELLSSAEEALAQPYGRGWLDLQRYALTAADELGEDYEAVGAAIRSALRALLADRPDLALRTLMDDSPTANAETRSWLHEAKLISDGTDAAPVPEESRPTLRPTIASRRDAYDAARARANAGDPHGAMELLIREATREKSARARFIRRVQAAEIMVGAKMEAIALPILREMLDQVEAHRLEEWEAGETVAQPLDLLYRCIIALNSGAVDPQSLYERICRLDPVRAVQLPSRDSANEH
ncbi:MAG: type VI secretion system domain-containing protein, partial [Longimicrobiales bacterium]